MTLQEWMDAKRIYGYYKDCQIVACDKISERYALIEVQIPYPLGSHHKEIVPLNTIIESRPIPDED